MAVDGVETFVAGGAAVDRGAFDADDLPREDAFDREFGLMFLATNLPGRLLRVAFKMGMVARAFCY